MFPVKSYLLLLVLLNTLNVFSQKQRIYTSIDSMPSFPGGDSALSQFLLKNTSYPLLAIKNNVQGLVQLSFVIDSTGKLINSMVVKGIGSGCDEEALLVLSKMPKWNPGILNGKKVAVIFNVPFAFDFSQSLPCYAKNGVLIYQTIELQAKWNKPETVEDYLKIKMNPFINKTDSLFFDLQITIDSSGNVMNCSYTKSFPSSFFDIEKIYETLVSIIKETSGYWNPPQIEGEKVASTVFAKFTYPH